MKKYVLLSILLSTGLALNGCTAFNNLFETNDNGVAVSDNNDQDNPDSESSAEVDQPTATLKITRNNKKNEIKASIVTNWNGVPQGSIYLNWKAPEETSCYNTSFPITKFKDIEDYTTDLESIASDNVICTGTWTATITNKADDSELASDSITIK
jgi:hypothetical protein